jgi:hypothetical protein
MVRIGDESEGSDEIGRAIYDMIWRSSVVVEQHHATAGMDPGGCCVMWRLLVIALLQVCAKSQNQTYNSPRLRLGPMNSATSLRIRVEYQDVDRTT